MSRWLWSLVTCVCLVLAEERVNYDGSQLIEVHGVDKQLYKKLIDLELSGDLELWNKNNTNVDVFVRKEKLENVKKELQDSDLKFRVLVDNVQQGIESENPPIVEPEDFVDGRKGHRITFEHYHRLDDIHGYLNYLAQTYPEFVEVLDIGKSYENRTLKVVKISPEGESEKSIWIDGGIHAREWISPASVLYIISELVENRGDYTNYTKGITYYILPVFNPDGYEFSHTVDRFWRKNRASASQFCVGTDLNRNWGYRWGGAGSSHRPCDQIYAGRKAFSEPETAAVSKFVLKNAANMKAYITFHSYGQFILYPWGYDEKVPPDYADLNRVGNKAANAMRSVDGYTYTVGSSANTLYAASGGSDDWAKGTAKIKYTYTIELRDTGRYGFVLPARYIKETAKEALAAVKVVTQAVHKTR